MESLYREYRRLLQQTDTRFVRYIHDEISWDSRLVAILGSRGVGKSTLILQHIKQFDSVDESLYVSADDFYFSSHRLYDLAEQFANYGGKRLYIDEIHKYKGWSTEIKNIYDKLPTLKVVYTGSSILELEKGGADLSRRKVEYIMHGLSFREYLNIKYGWSLTSSSLEDILAGKTSFPMADERPLQLFRQYLKEGYYPFFTEGDYTRRLTSVLKQITEVDIPTFADMNVASVQKLKKLLYMLAQSVPVKPNYAKLERDLDISRNTLPSYMLYLEKAGLLQVLTEKASGVKLLEKIEKIYLNNTNISYVLSDTEPDIGNVRETVFMSLMKVRHNITSSKISDFEVDGITFEVGGRTKGQKQIETATRGYIVKDDIEYAFQNQIPLWMFGFIY